jgi:histidinol-phosphate/aromatic aminotransferase/cobyric acid decarboxylase-like protein
MNLLEQRMNEALPSDELAAQMKAEAEESERQAEIKRQQEEFRKAMHDAFHGAAEDRGTTPAVGSSEYIRRLIQSRSKQGLSPNTGSLITAHRFFRPQLD